jgi:hypothetical protein
MLPGILPREFVFPVEGEYALKGGGPVGRIGYAPSIIAFNMVPGRVGHLSYAANSIAYMVSPSANKFGTNQ